MTSSLRTTRSLTGTVTVDSMLTWVYVSARSGRAWASRVASGRSCSSRHPLGKHRRRAATVLAMDTRIKLCQPAVTRAPDCHSNHEICGPEQDLRWLWVAPVNANTGSAPGRVKTAKRRREVLRRPKALPYNLEPERPKLPPRRRQFLQPFWTACSHVRTNA
jgi:hypothetical protein